MLAPPEPIKKELIEDEMKMLIQFIERHVHWSKSPENERLSRLNMIAAESLIESAELIRTLCEMLSDD
jgi:hypothetical protein